MAGYDDDLRFAHVLADAADAAAIDRFRARDLSVTAKPDLSPVSDADKTVEERIRTTLSRARPRDSILGEEFGGTGSSPRCWVIDPIDGTENYLRGVPAWATLIALMDGNDVMVGVVSAPALNRRWWASIGSGTYTGRSLHSATRCRASAVGLLRPGRVGLRRAFGAVRVADPGLPAHPRLRRLLVVHAGS
jgi:histidinol-phosphatase